MAVLADRYVVQGEDRHEDVKDVKNEFKFQLV